MTVQFSSDFIQKILKEWTSDEKFREQFRKNPSEALKKRGFEVTPETEKELQALSRQFSDQLQENRLSKDCNV
jgi:hypothetical protein